MKREDVKREDVKKRGASAHVFTFHVSRSRSRRVGELLRDRARIGGAELCSDPPADRVLALRDHLVARQVDLLQKTWEIRNRPASRTGGIALCKKGGLILGTCVIGPSIRIPRERFDEHFEKHRVSPRAMRNLYPTGPLYAWPLSDVRRLVRLTRENVQVFERLQAA